MYISSEKALKIGMVVVIAAVVVLGISVYGIISSETSGDYYTVHSGESKNVKVNVTQGILLTYTVLIKTNSTDTFRAWFSEPSGKSVLESNFTGAGISESIVAPEGGLWVFHMENLGKNSSYLRVHLGQLSLALEAALISGISALVVGLVLIGYFFSMQKRERIRRVKSP